MVFVLAIGDEPGRVERVIVRTRDRGNVRPRADARWIVEISRSLDRIIDGRGALLHGRAEETSPERRRNSPSSAVLSFPSSELSPSVRDILLVLLPSSLVLGSAFGLGRV